MIKMNDWDKEYLRKGIPSSFLVEPSGVLLWALANWSYVSCQKLPKTALDVGCGTGRNTLYLAKQGIEAYGFDQSVEAITKARKQQQELRLEPAPQFWHHDLQNGIPTNESSMDLVMDIFVYKHQIDSEVRASYRREVARVLQPSGIFLLSLAEPEDGYYGSCPLLEEKSNQQGLQVILDPVAQIPSILFSLSSLVEEMKDQFSLCMAFRKEKIGIMHGHSYLRKTLATLWKKNSSSETLEL